MSKLIWFMLFVSLPFSVYGIDLSRLYGHLRPPVQKRSGRFSTLSSIVIRHIHRQKCINSRTGPTDRNERKKKQFPLCACSTVHRAMFSCTVSRNRYNDSDPMAITNGHARPKPLKQIIIRTYLGHVRGFLAVSVTQVVACAQSNAATISGADYPELPLITSNTSILHPYNV